jgi:glycosyl transferase family 87
MTGWTDRARKIAEFLAVGVCTITFLMVVIGMGVAFFHGQAPGTRDFIEYWASGHQLARHANPYDGHEIAKLECAAGLSCTYPPMIMWNPPFVLPLVIVLGVLDPISGLLLWEILLLASLFLSIDLIRRLHGFPKSPLHLLCYTFVPVLSCLQSGQITIFMMLGLVLFLTLHQSRPFLAGASLWLCLLKPHLFLPFGIAMMLWIVYARAFRILAGTVFALALSSIIATAMDPSVWFEYARMMKSAGVKDLPMWSVSYTLRQYVHPDWFWLQWLPVCLGSIWGAVYFWKHRAKWDWTEDGALLLLVSVMVAPYSWFMDQAVAIPALMHGAYAAHSRASIVVLALTSAVVEVEILCGFPLLHSVMYVWTVPAWLAWYLWVSRSTQETGAFDLTAGAVRTV